MGNIKKIINNARRAGVNIGIRDQRVRRSANPAVSPSASFKPAAAVPTMSVQPDLDRPQIVVPGMIAQSSLSKYYTNRLAEAQYQFKRLGLHGNDILSGHTYYLLLDARDLQEKTLLHARVMPHKGGTHDHDFEFMRTLATREGARLRMDYLRANPKYGGDVAQVIVIVPPLDKSTGLIPRLDCDRGYAQSFDRYNDPHTFVDRMGVQRASLIDNYKDEWRDIGSEAPRSFDIMKTIHMSCGDLRKPWEP